MVDIRTVVANNGSERATIDKGTAPSKSATAGSDVQTHAEKATQRLAPKLDATIDSLVDALDVGIQVLRVLQLSLKWLTSRSRARNRELPSSSVATDSATVEPSAPLGNQPSATARLQTAARQKLSKLTSELRTQVTDEPPAYLTTQLLVTIRPDAVRARGSSRAATRGVLVEQLESPFDFLERDGLIEDVTAVAAHGPAPGPARAARLSLAASVLESDDSDLTGVNLIRLSRRTTVNEVIKLLGNNDAILDIERVPYRRLVPPRGLKGVARASSRAWNLSAVRWYEAGRRCADTVRVAVLDTGIDEEHPALATAIASYEHGGVTSEDIVGHGTHVAGVIAGLPQAGTGFEGGICSARLYIWKIFEDEPNEQTGEFIVNEVLYLRALEAVRTQQCKVLNLSIGGAVTSSQEKRLFKRLIESGITIVAAMGNEYLDGNPVSYPAAHDDVIAVGAVNSDLRRSKFSNTGGHIALAAPGEGVFSTLPTRANQWRSETNYGSWDGTSMATPHVSGAAAHLLSSNGGLSPGEIRARLAAMALKVQSMESAKWSRGLGAGLLQLADP